MLKALLFITALFSAVVLSFSSAPAGAVDILGGACKTAPNSPTCQQRTAQQQRGTNPVVRIVHTATDLIAAVAGAAAVIVIIVAGFQFITAGGATPGQRSSDPNKIKTARASLTG